jgi:hypothetical protein
MTDIDNQVYNNAAENDEMHWQGRIGKGDLRIALTCELPLRWVRACCTL